MMRELEGTTRNSGWNRPCLWAAKQDRALKSMVRVLCAAAMALALLPQGLEPARKGLEGCCEK
jgi:hypothetical protein